MTLVRIATLRTDDVLLKLVKVCLSLSTMRSSWSRYTWSFAPREGSEYPNPSPSSTFLAMATITCSMAAATSRPGRSTTSRYASVRFRSASVLRTSGWRFTAASSACTLASTSSMDPALPSRPSLSFFRALFTPSSGAFAPARLGGMTPARVDLSERV